MFFNWPCGQNRGRKDDPSMGGPVPTDLRGSVWNGAVKRAGLGMASSLLVVVVIVLMAAASAAATAPVLSFRVFASSGIKLADILWTGTRFLYLENTTNTVWSANAAGAPLQQFASMPNETEETRCRLSPGTHGFAPGDIYCHAPDNTIYRISPSGTVTQFAKLSDTATSDGALTFDNVGRFGYTLVAATGRSGGATPAGGAVYTISATGQVQTVGTYSSPGGADEVAIAPAGFGSAAGEAILTVDAGPTGAILAVDSHGAIRTIAKLPDGPNPIAVIPTALATGNASPPRGLYVTDTNSQNVFFAPSAQLAPYAGDIVVATEIKGEVWIVRPHGQGFQTRRVASTLPATNGNLEGATYIG